MCSSGTAPFSLGRHPGERQRPAGRRIKRTQEQHFLSAEKKGFLSHFKERALLEKYEYCPVSFCKYSSSKQDMM
jgi:hypothetical protein